jgi:murein DD-endopeptidase MepM/ murein hydrolase activator NlpD
MTKVKYKFDPESLQFTEQDVSFKSKFIRQYLGVIIAGILIAFCLLFISAYVVVSPETRKMHRENRLISKDFKEQMQRYAQTEKVLKDVEKRDDNIYKAVLESDPKELKSDTVSSYIAFLQKTENMKPLELATYVESLLDSLMRLMKSDEENYKSFAKIFNSKANMFDFVPSIQPVDNQTLNVIIYGYGKRIDPFYRTPIEHKGLDYSVAEGTKIRCTADGFVSFTGDIRAGGNTVMINHGFGFETKYCHLDQILVSKGKKVKRGDYIGTVGNTGKSMAPHLHYEVIVKGKPVNPVNFFFADLNASKYSKIIRMSSMGGISLD